MAGQLLERIAVLMKSDLVDFLEIDLEDTDAPTENIDRLLAEFRAALGERLAIVHTKSKSVSALADEVADYAAKAEFAVSVGRENLAHSALMRKLELARKVDTIRDELALIDAEVVHLEAAIRKLIADRAHLLGETSSIPVGDQATLLAELDALVAAKKKN